MVARFNLFISVRISGSISGEVKKIEAQAKKRLLYEIRKHKLLLALMQIKHQFRMASIAYKNFIYLIHS